MYFLNFRFTKFGEMEKMPEISLRKAIWDISKNLGNFPKTSNLLVSDGSEALKTKLINWEIL
jgi:hypothetical protein